MAVGVVLAIVALICHCLFLLEQPLLLNTGHGLLRVWSRVRQSLAVDFDAVRALVLVQLTRRWRLRLRRSY